MFVYYNEHFQVGKDILLNQLCSGESCIWTEERKYVSNIERVSPHTTRSSSSVNNQQLYNFPIH